MAPSDAVGRLLGCGLGEAELAAWATLCPPDPVSGSLDDDADALSAYLRAGKLLRDALPARPARGVPEQEAVAALDAELAGARAHFLRAHAEGLYRELTGDLSQALRLDALLAGVAERVPGLAPSAAEMAVEHGCPLPEQEGIEIAEGQVLAHMLSSPACGAHLVWAMLRPTPEALELLDEFVATGVADLSLVHLRREGRAAVLELRNPRHLNAEDDETLHRPRSPSTSRCFIPTLRSACSAAAWSTRALRRRRIFGAGLNLTRLYLGLIPYRFFIDRDLGYVNKLYRGLTPPSGPPGALEKPWIAGVETYAIGGACQLLHVMDHVIAERGARLFPARAQRGDHSGGVEPAACPRCRRPRRPAGHPVGDGVRGRRADGDLLCDETVERGRWTARSSVAFEL